jgi:transposase-like protein
MDIYKKPSVTVHQRDFYTDDFKRMVCDAYLLGGRTKERIRLDFGMKGNSTLSYWLEKLGYLPRDNKLQQKFPEVGNPKKEENKSLEKENEDLKLQLEMYKRMISIAEKEYKISIEKKSDTK